MAAHYFSLEEANALLSTIKPVMGLLLAKRARVVKLSQQAPFIEDLYSDVGGPLASELVQEFATIEALVQEIQSHGCLIKDLNIGLLDFLTERNGREVYLCWRYGEEEITHYHELHKGFADRRHV